MKNISRISHQDNLFQEKTDFSVGLRLGSGKVWQPAGSYHSLLQNSRWVIRLILFITCLGDWFLCSCWDILCSVVGRYFFLVSSAGSVDTIATAGTEYPSDSYRIAMINARCVSHLISYDWQYICIYIFFNTFKLMHDVFSVENLQQC